MRRDDGVGMEGRKDVDLTKGRPVRGSVRVEGPRHGSQGWAGAIRAAHVSARIPGIIAATAVRVARRRTPPPPGPWSPRQSAPADDPGHSSLTCSVIDTLPPSSPKNPLSWDSPILSYHRAVMSDASQEPSDVLDMFLAQVKECPRIATVDDADGEFSYEELASLAFRVAGTIRSVTDNPCPGCSYRWRPRSARTRR